MHYATMPTMAMMNEPATNMCHTTKANSTQYEQYIARCPGMPTAIQMRYGLPVPTCLAAGGHMNGKTSTGNILCLVRVLCGGVSPRPSGPLRHHRARRPVGRPCVCGPAGTHLPLSSCSCRTKGLMDTRAGATHAAVAAVPAWPPPAQHLGIRPCTCARRCRQCAPAELPA